MRFYSNRGFRKQKKSQRCRIEPLRRVRPVLELLEERRLLAVFTVNTTVDSVDVDPGDGIAADKNGLTSLRAAVMEADALGGSNTIILPAGTYDLTLAGSDTTTGATAATGDLTLTGSFTIQGAGPEATIIDGSGLGDRVFDIPDYNPAVTLEGLAVTGGKAPGPADTFQEYGGGLRAGASTNLTIDDCIFRNDQAPDTNASQNLVYGIGGAIASGGNVSISNSAFDENYASNSGGALYLYGSAATVVTIQNTTFDGNKAIQGGGAIQSDVATTINGCTFSNNVASDAAGNSGQGAALEIGWDLQMTNTTISGNRAIFGGAMSDFSSRTNQTPTLSIQSCTIANNQALYGGGIYGGGTNVTMENSILGPDSATVSGPDLSGTIDSLGHNIVANTSGSTGFGATGDLLNVDPKLNALADNGGPTQTMALQPSSPAIDAANPATAPATDQRGVKRPIGNGPDIGAYEYNGSVAGPPVAVNDSYSVSENGILNVAASGVLANDNNGVIGSLTATLVSTTSHGSLTLNADGSFVYTPAAGFSGTDTFSYEDVEGSQTSTPATVTITVVAVPVAQNDSYAVNENFSLTVATPGVLANDTAANSSALAAVLIGGPSHGTLSLHADGSFVYTPAANFHGTDSFTYDDTEGVATSNAATVTLTVNQMPVAVADNYAVNENGSLAVSAAGVLTNDIPLNSTPLAASLVSGPSNGSLTLNSDGSFVYTPNAGFHGSDSFLYDDTEGGLTSAPALVTISVNPVPTAVNDSYSTNENTPLVVSAPGVTSLTMSSQAGDWVGQGLSYSFAPATGSFSAAVTGANDHDLTFSYQDKSPNQWWMLEFASANGGPLVPGTYTGAARAGFQSVGQPGLDVYGDGRGSNTLTGSFTVTQAAYDASGKVLTFDATFVQYGDGSKAALTGEIKYNAAPAIAGVLTNDQPVNSTPILANLVGGPSHGSVSLNANGTFTYVPAANFYGTDSFTYDDTEGNLTSNVAAVTIAVTQTAVAVADSYSVFENSSLSVNAASGVLVNDIPINGDPLTPNLVSQPGHGSLTFNADGSFVYTPAANFNGTDSFTYDDTQDGLTSVPATVTITVKPVPVAVNDSFTTNENTPLAETVTSLTMSSQPGDYVGAGQSYNLSTATGSFSVIHFPSDNELEFFYQGNSNPADFWMATFVAPQGASLVPGTYNNAARASFQAANQPGLDVSGDGRGSSTLTGSFVVNEAVYDASGNVLRFDATFVQYGDNSTSALTGEIKYNASAGIGGVLFNDLPANSTPLSAVLVTGPSHGTVALNPNGTFTYTPNSEYYGGDSFTYQDTEGSQTSNIATVNLTVNFVNAPPSFTEGANQSIPEGSAAQTVRNWATNISPGPPDESGQTLTFHISTNNNGLFSVLPAIDPTTGTLTYTPAAGALGTATVTVTLQDNGGTANGGVDTSPAQTFTIAVNNVPPAVTLGTNPSINEGGTMTAAGSFSDPGMETWTATVDYGDGGGPQALPLNADKTFNLSHAYAEDGTYTVTVVVTDSNQGVGSNTMTVTVNEVPPTAIFGNSGPVSEGSPVAINFINPYSPSQADTSAGFHYSIAQSETGLATSYASAASANSASFTYSEAGTYTVYGKIIDSDGASTEYTTTVTVSEVAPTATFSNNGSVGEGSPVTASFTNPYSPSQLDTSAGFHYSFAQSQAGLATSYAAAGTASSANFTYAEAGSYTVYGAIFDAHGESTQYTTTVTVNEVAPTATFSNNGPVGEGSPVTASFTNPYSPSQVDTSAGFHYSIAQSQAGLATSYAAAGTATSANFTYAEAGSYTVYGVIFDAHGDSTQYTTTVTVNEAPPTASISGSPTSVRGEPQTFTFSAKDPGQAASFSYVIKWGDGSQQTVSGGVSIQQTHIYAASGNFSPTVTVSDDDGGTSPSAGMAVSVAAAALQNGSLVVGGTTGADTIVVTPSDLTGDLKVTINGASVGVFHPTVEVVVYGQAGNDSITLQDAKIKNKTAYVDLPSALFGGDGNDVLDARGSSANAILVGGAGNDRLYGGRDRNLLIGGTGSDTLYGGSGDDILIGGATDYDANLAALNAIMAEWGRTGVSFQQRVNDLTGATTGGLNGPYLLTSSTVHEDGAVDHFYGNGGQDWIFEQANTAGPLKEKGLT